MDARFSRLLLIIQEIRGDPKQDVKELIKKTGVSRSQYYKDKAKLEDVGFSYNYSKKRGFEIIEDYLSPVGHLSLSEIVLLMFSLKNLNACGDGHLAAKALALARKMASVLDEPLRSQILNTFDEEVIGKNYGVKPHIYSALEKAVNKCERISILYRTSRDWKDYWYLVDPEQLYFVQRALYLYGYCPEKKTRHRSFRVSRISDVKSTGLRFPLDKRDQQFPRKLKNAFSAFIGLDATEVVLKITGRSACYVSENLWHHSQQIERISQGEIRFYVHVAEPREVIWWARQFGDEAEVLKPDWLKEEVENNMLKIPAVTPDR